MVSDPQPASVQRGFQGDVLLPAALQLICGKTIRPTPWSRQSYRGQFLCALIIVDCIRSAARRGTAGELHDNDPADSGDDQPLHFSCLE